MSGEPPESIVQAKRNAARARARVDTDVAALKQRLHPRSLAEDAIDNVREKRDQAVDAAKRRPLIAGLAGGTAALIVLRKPLKALYRLVSRRLLKPEAEPAEAAAARRRKGNGAAPDSVSAPPDDLIPHAAVPQAATRAKQE